MSVEPPNKDVQLARAMFGDDDISGDYAGGFKLLCPFCQCDYVHLRNVEHTAGKDNYAAAGVYGMHVRGGVTALPFWGECGHRWALIFGEHKGMVFGRVMRLSDDRTFEDDDSRDTEAVE